MTCAGFSRFLESDECQITPPPDKTTAQLDLPLSHYYVSGAHDAYVPDDPAANTASMDAIVRALAQPCRYVKRAYSSSVGVTVHGYDILPILLHILPTFYSSENFGKHAKKFFIWNLKKKKKMLK